MPPPWMRPATSGRRSPAMQRVYLRRRIVAALVVLVPILLIVFLLTSGGGGGKKKPQASASTTTTAPHTTTTVALQLVASVATWHLPVDLSRSVVLPVNTDLGVFGGLTTSGTSGKIYEIDPGTGTTTAVATMPVPVRDAGGAVIGSTYYVFGGATTAATETAAVQGFSFTSSTQMNGSVVSNLTAKRSAEGAATVSGQVYLVGGYDGTAYVSSVVSTSDGMNFAPSGTLSPAVRYPAVAALNGMVYVIGGEVSPHAADSTVVQQINLTTSTVTDLSPLAVGLSHAVAVTLNNNIYVLGGRSGGHAIATISLLNPTTGQLQPVGQLPSARSDMGVAVIGQTAYLIGGEGDGGKPVDTVVTVRLVPAGTA